jgi:P-type Ca2+ transporter type 2B
MICIFGL